MKAILIIIMLSISISSSVAQERKYMRSYHLRLQDNKRDRKAGTAFQIVGGIGMVFATSIAAYYHPRNYPETKYKPAGSIIGSSGVFLMGTAIKINAGRMGKKKRK